MAEDEGSGEGLDFYPICTCIKEDDDSIPENLMPQMSKHKMKTVYAEERTDNYLRTHRINDLIKYLFTKIITQTPDNPIAYIEKLLDSCMLYRVGHGPAPVIYEDRHLQAVLKSFDPGNRGWLSAGQVRRAFFTLMLKPIEIVEEKMPTEMVFKALKEAQEMELYQLFSAGVTIESINNYQDFCR